MLAHTAKALCKVILFIMFKITCYDGLFDLKQFVACCSAVGAVLTPQNIYYVIFSMGSNPATAL
jgi:hypothetical protein